MVAGRVMTATPSVCRVLTALIDADELGRFDVHPATRSRMIADDLIEEFGDHHRVRLTAHGRAVLAELAAQ